MQKVIQVIRALPSKKQYVEFFTAILTVPVLLTVIILNISNLKPKETTTETKPEQKQVVVNVPSTPKQQESSTKAAVSPTEQCKEKIGPFTLDGPEENENVTENPVIFEVSYPDSSYCAIVWSYRINDGKWSDYGDNSIALYNLPNGTVRFDLRVKSIVNGKEENIQRRFTYIGVSNPSPTPEPTTLTSTPSAQQ